MSGIKHTVLAVALLSAFVLTGCGGRHTDPPREESQGTGTNMDAVTTADPAPAPESTQEPAAIPDENANSEEIPEQGAEEESTMKITVGEHQFTITLEDNAAAAALKEHLPMTLDMSELNGNEKYHYLSFSLPTNPYSPGKIESGDVMLYGDSCLVVFYESFSTPYSYTRIGRINDAAGLRTAVGAGDVQITFE